MTVSHDPGGKRDMFVQSKGVPVKEEQPSCYVH